MAIARKPMGEAKVPAGIAPGFFQKMSTWLSPSGWALAGVVLVAFGITVVLWARSGERSPGRELLDLLRQPSVQDGLHLLPEQTRRVTELTQRQSAATN